MVRTAVVVSSVVVPGLGVKATAKRHARAAVVVDEVSGKIDVPDGASGLLDVGGGRGLYAIELCRKCPDLVATVFDNPDALEAARKEIAAAGIEGRVGTSAGDYWADDPGTGYDIALLFILSDISL